MDITKSLSKILGTSVKKELLARRTALHSELTTIDAVLEATGVEVSNDASNGARIGRSPGRKPKEKPLKLRSSSRPRPGTGIAKVLTVIQKNPGIDRVKLIKLSKKVGFTGAIGSPIRELKQKGHIHSKGDRRHFKYYPSGGLD